MVNFEEKKPEMSESERQERMDLIQLCKDCFNLFKLALDEQTARVENGQGQYITTAELQKQGPEDRNNNLVSSSRKRGVEGEQSRNETQMGLLDESVGMKAKSGGRKGAADLSQ